MRLQHVYHAIFDVIQKGDKSFLDFLLKLVLLRYSSKEVQGVKCYRNKALFLEENSQHSTLDKIDYFV
jgi:hypothetical protein